MKNLTEANIQKAVAYSIRTSKAIYLALSVKNPRQSRNYQKNKASEWDFIPSEADQILDALEIVKRRVKKSELILDLGCGASPFLGSLYQLGFKNLLGIDNEAEKIPYNSIMNVLYHVGTSSKFENVNFCRYGNLLDMNKFLVESIQNAQFIYMFLPIANMLLYEKVLINIMRSMNSGAILYESHSNPEIILKGDNLQYLKSNFHIIYEKYPGHIIKK
jgi:SAM-dependent methyltransferase